MKKFPLLWAVCSLFLLILFSCGEKKPTSQAGTFAGSKGCPDCHEKFYQLWATSHHGTAMQPFSGDFAKAKLTGQKDEVVIGRLRYRVEIASGKGWVSERGGPEGEKRYPMEHVMGGKNVYYFLTTLSRGRLQVLPVAYDVREKSWFDTPASAVRHFPDLPNDSPVGWKEWPFTFNTACYSCHVSQLSTNYDLKTDTYRTTWSEPGINCETCHGPAEEHIRVCRESPKGKPPADLKIKRGGRDFTAEQNNAACAPCHARMMPFSNRFEAGDRFFDHFDLITLEHPDFYPDGRDLGENYTYTLWRMSPCARSGQLDCLHCHTSSGRYRFGAKGQENNACLPCHRQRVEDVTAHTHHKADSEGSHCIACHMPMTEFARMRRSDHSMGPPTPAATIEYQSPNACNLCHKDRDASWADKYVREWHGPDYQGPKLYRAGLIQAGRNRDWSKLSEISAYLGSKDRDEVFATSLIRLLAACEDPAKWPAVQRAIKDPSPLVRAAAAALMAHNLTAPNIAGLLLATRDDYRLVRIRSAEALAGLPRQRLSEQDRKALDAASAEFEAAMEVRPDHHSSHYNLANYYMKRGDLHKAVGRFETAIALGPDSIMPLVNVALVYARLGQPEKARASLARALIIEPDSAEANFNMGLLKAEQNDLQGAEKHLRTALKSETNFPEAAYNLGVLLAGQNLSEAIVWIRKAHHWSRGQAKYGFTAAFYLRKNKEIKEAIDVLRGLIRQHPRYLDAYRLLGEIYENRGSRKKATGVYRQALSLEDLAPEHKNYFETRIDAIAKSD